MTATVEEMQRAPVLNYFLGLHHILLVLVLTLIIFIECKCFGGMHIMNDLGRDVSKWLAVAARGHIMITMFWLERTGIAGRSYAYG